MDLTRIAGKAARLVLQEAWFLRDCIACWRTLPKKPKRAHRTYIGCEANDRIAHPDELEVDRRAA